MIEFRAYVIHKSGLQLGLRLVKRVAGGVGKDECTVVQSMFKQTQLQRVGGVAAVSIVLRHRETKCLALRAVVEEFISSV